MNKDIGLTHIALTSRNIDASVQFYSDYANMSVVHQRGIEPGSTRVVWLSDKTRPFVIVLIESNQPAPTLGPFAHLGVGCESREALDKLCDRARKANILVREPVDTGYPAGYWAFIKDPDGHNLELSYGQEVGLTVANA